jgi:hypothetical protein
VVNADGAKYLAHGSHHGMTNRPFSELEA